MTSYFEQKTILITGASRGIGAALAYALAAPGTKLILNCHRDVMRLDQVMAEIIKQVPTCQCYPWIWDLAKKEGLEDSLLAVCEIAGMPDILINNAGIAKIACLQDMDVQEISNMLAVNLQASILLTRFCIPHMIQKNHEVQEIGGPSPCRILNISSVWGMVGASCETVYSATKAGLNGFTRALAKELAPSRISVNALSCGAIATEMNDCLSMEEKRSLEEEIPSGRMALPEEVAQMAVQVLTAPEYCTGQVIGFDGGWM